MIGVFSFYVDNNISTSLLKSILLIKIAIMVWGSEKYAIQDLCRPIYTTEILKFFRKKTFLCWHFLSVEKTFPLEKIDIQRQRKNNYIQQSKKQPNKLLFIFWKFFFTLNLCCFHNILLLNLSVEQTAVDNCACTHIV